jgi:DNA excision repair protein ERCC-8
MFLEDLDLNSIHPRFCASNFKIPQIFSNLKLMKTKLDLHLDISPTTSICFHQNHLLYAGRTNLTLTVNRKSARKLHEQVGVTGLEWFPYDTAIFTSCASDASLKLWDANLLESVYDFKLMSPINKHSWSMSGLIAVGGEEQKIRLLDPNIGSSSHVLPGHKIGVSSLDWSPSEEFLLASGGLDGAIKFWDIRRATPCLLEISHSLTKKLACVNSVVFTSDGLSLLSCATDEHLQLWDAGNGRNRNILYGSHFRNRCEKPVNMRLSKAALGLSTQIYIPSKSVILVYDLISGKLMKRFTGHIGQISDIAIADESFFSCGLGDGVIKWS